MYKNVEHRQLRKFRLRQIVRRTAPSYLGLIAFGTIAMQLSNQQWQRLFRVSDVDVGAWTLLTLTSMVIVLACSELFELTLPSFRQHRALVSQMVGPLSRSACAYVSIFSAIAEELLFRATLQPILGPVLTALSATLLHIGPQATFTGWTGYTLIAQSLFCLLFHQTGSVYPALVASVLTTWLVVFRINYKVYRRICDQIDGDSGDLARRKT